MTSALLDPRAPVIDELESRMRAEGLLDEEAQA